MTKKYTIGIDYGTQSGRAVIVDLSNGAEIADHVTPYAHHVMDSYIPTSDIPLPSDWALQHPLDYMDVIFKSIPAVLQLANIDPNQIIGIGIDFTACTMLPINEQGDPLCTLKEYEANPHSWVKLWKHHAAQEEANRINEIAAERGERWLQRYGGKISSEWMIAKLWQIWNEAPDIYEATDQFVEATDWVVGQLTGVIMRNSCTAGYKAIWHKQEGYPSEAFFKALDPHLEKVTSTKLRGDIVPLGTRVGGLSEHIAVITGLPAGIAVAAGNVDAHAAVPAVGVVTPGQLVMAMGTSICHMLLGADEQGVEGMCGVVEDGIIPGLYGYEAGQSAVGDIFEWFVTEAVPAYCKEAATQAGLNIHEWLEQQASKLAPGESGLIALDWWNGNRSVLVDTDLTGVMLGMTLLTKPEEQYRALLEATAYGTRTIVEAFRQHGLDVDILYACGGLPQKNNLLMQIYADVTNMEIKVAASKHTPAVGAAMFAAVAAGKAAGGYDSIVDAAKQMASIREQSFQPIAENVAIYNALYEQYNTLHDYFGRDSNDVMKKLKQIKLSVSN